MFNLNNILIGLGGVGGLIVLIATVCTVYYRRKKYLELKGINEGIKELVEVLGR